MSFSFTADFTLGRSLVTVCDIPSGEQEGRGRGITSMLVVEPKRLLTTLLSILRESAAAAAAATAVRSGGPCVMDVDMLCD